jgi:hypothetical protein
MAVLIEKWNYFPAAEILLEAENGPARVVGSNAGVMVYGKE